MLVPLLAILAATRPDSGPRINAVVEVYRQGISRLHYAKGHLRTERIDKDEDAYLRSFPDRVYAISDRKGVTVFQGNRRTPVLHLKGGEILIGWSHRQPIVSDKNRRPRLGAKPMPTNFVGAEEIRDLPDGGWMVKKFYEKGGTTYASFASSTGRIGRACLKIKGIQPDSRACGHGIAIFAESTRDAENWTDLWWVDRNGDRTKRLTRLRGRNWQFIESAREPEELLFQGGGGSDVEQNRFEYFSVYRLTTKGRLEVLVSIRGDMTYYGFDQTGKWMIASRGQGWEKGIYDLVAINMKTRQEQVILDSVTFCHLIDNPPDKPKR